MFSFFKKKEDNDAVPEWAAFFDSKEYGVFTKEIDEYFTHLPYRIEQGELRFSPPQNFVKLLNELKD
jgi:hypothetical protein